MTEKNEHDEPLLTPDALRAWIEELSGPGLKGVRAFTAGCGLNYTTVWRYLQGDRPIPEYVGTIVRLLAYIKRQKMPLPQEFIPPDDRPKAPEPVRWWES